MSEEIKGQTEGQEAPANTETIGKSEQKPKPKKKRKLQKIFLAIVLISCAITYFTYDPKKDVVVHTIELQGDTVYSEYLFANYANSLGWESLYDFVARETIGTMKDILKDERFNQAERAVLIFNRRRVDKSGNIEKFLVAEFSIPLALWKESSITDNFLSVAPLLSVCFIRAPAGFEKVLFDTERQFYLP